MGRKNKPNLSEEQKLELSNGLRNGKTHALRSRCQAILLKAEGRTSKEVGSIVGMCHVSVNSWLKRYNNEGMRGLVTKPGRGRKPLINKEADQHPILAAVKANRQRLSMAKAEWEAQRGEHGTAVGRETFRNFLKALADDTSE